MQHYTSGWGVFDQALTNPLPPVSVEQKGVAGNGNVASGVNTGTISVTVTREHRQNKEQK